jgi:hypothetical protein
MPFTGKDINDFIDFFNFFKVREKYGAIYQNLVFIGLFSLWLIYYNSNNLLIPIKDLSVVSVSADILITLLFFRFYKQNFSLVWAFIHNLTIGLIVAFLFIWTNDNFSVKPLTTEVLQIENVDLQDNHQRHNRGLEPVVTVTIKGKPHEITYHKSLTKSALNARQIEVTLKEGFWGYWVLTDIELIKNE